MVFQEFFLFTLLTLFLKNKMSDGFEDFGKAYSHLLLVKQPSFAVKLTDN